MYFSRKSFLEMILRQLILNPKLPSTSASLLLVNSLSAVRSYTCIVERVYKPRTVRKEIDQRKTILNSKSFVYRLVDVTHNKPWGNVDLILTQYVEGKK